MTNLLDILKETELRVRFTDVFRTVGSREVLPMAVLQRRLLLCLHGLGTNAGLKRMCSGGGDDSYSDLQYVRRRYVTKEHLRSAIAQVCNAIFRVRDAGIWGEATTACASDSKKFGAWDQNLMTEWQCTLRWSRRDDLLACRKELGLRVLAAQGVLLVRGCGHD